MNTPKLEPLILNADADTAELITEPVSPTLSSPALVECNVATIFLPPCNNEPLTAIAIGATCE